MSALNDNWEVGLIEADTLSVYGNLLTKEVVTAMQNDEPYIALGVEKDGMACGAVAGQLEDEDLFQIESLYVAPEARRQGAATILLDTLMKELVRINPTLVFAIDFEDDEDGDEAEALVSFLYAQGIPEGETADPRYEEEERDRKVHHFVFFND